MKESLDKSDWIQYIISEKNRYLTISLAFLSIMILLFLGIVAAHFYYKNYLAYLILFIMYFFIAYKALYHLVNHKKTRKFLEKIMKNNEIDIDTIKDDFFNPGDKKMNKFSKIFENKWYILSSLAIVLAIVLFIGAVSLSSIGTINNAVSTAIQILISLGVGFYSIGIAFISIGVATESDEKMIGLSTAHFLEIADNFDRIKNYIFNNCLKPSKIRSGYIWKCRGYLYQSLQLIKWVDPKEQLELIKFYNKLIEKLTKNDGELTTQDITNFRLMNEHIQKFDIDKSYKEKPTKLLKPYLEKE